MARFEGGRFSRKQIERIISLLRHTDLSLNEISQRMSCSRSAVAMINRKHKVRDYTGHRSLWKVLPARDLSDSNSFG